MKDDGKIENLIISYFNENSITNPNEIRDGEKRKIIIIFKMVLLIMKII